jgi:hypothetical protein
MGRFKSHIIGFIGAAGLALAATGQAHAVPVDLELSLVIDTSGSVDATEYTLQYQGYVDAFNSAAVQSAIAATTNGIAVNVVQFNTSASQQIGWTHLTNATDAGNFANAIAALFTPNVTAGGGSTDIAEGIDFATVSIGSNGFEGARLVIDVSGDGEQNVTHDSLTGPAAVQAQRNIAEAAGITINGLPILNDFPNLDTYYTNNVITTDGFVLAAASFNDFKTAVESKVFAEITDTNPVPEPGMLIIFGLGLAGLGIARRRRA